MPTISAAPMCQLHNRPMRLLAGRMICAGCLGESTSAAAALWDGLQSRMASDALEARLREAEIPELFVGRGFREFQPPTERARKMAARLEAFSADFARNRSYRTGFVFTGEPGTAKTHLACAMLQKVLDQGFRAVYASLPELTRSARSATGRGRAGEQMLGRLVEADLLVLDEIDLHGRFDSDYNMLYDIINSRYIKPGFPTVAISNRPVEELTRDLDERLVTRILAGTQALVFDWPGQRDVRAQRQLSGAEGANV